MYPTGETGVVLVYRPPSAVEVVAAEVDQIGVGDLIRRLLTAREARAAALCVCV